MQLITFDKNVATCANGVITVAALREWLASLPEDFQGAQFETCVGGFPVCLKRIVAYRSLSDPTDIGVSANGMGSHLPFDNSLVWEHILH